MTVVYQVLALKIDILTGYLHFGLQILVREDEKT